METLIVVFAVVGVLVLVGIGAAIWALVTHSDDKPTQRQASGVAVTQKVTSADSRKLPTRKPKAETRGVSEAAAKRSSPPKVAPPLIGESTREAGKLGNPLKRRGQAKRGKASWWFVAAVGAVLLACSYAVGVYEPTVNDSGESIQCQSALGGGQAEAGERDAQNEFKGNPTNLYGECVAKVEMFEFARWSLTIVGGLTIVGALVFGSRRE